MTAPLIPDAERAAREATVTSQASFKLWRSLQPYGGATEKQETAFRDGFEAARRELLARQVPTGWTAMPPELTPAMHREGYEAFVRAGQSLVSGFTADAMYRAILAAAHLPDNSAFSKPDQAPSED